MRTLWIFSPLLVTSLALGQKPTVKPPAPIFGTVSGTIVCTDTGLPARLTDVALDEVKELPPITATEAEKAEHVMVLPTKQVFRTHLDGSFLIPHVRPGRYYVIVQKPGYMSPVAMFTREEIDRPTPEIREKIASAIPIVTVDENKTATVNLRLNRAASVSGMIHYDDGTSASGLQLTVQRQNKAGKWVSQSENSFGGTDDLGHYRITGLPAGEYRLSTHLSIDDHFTDRFFGGAQAMRMMTKYELSVYAGDTFREKDAKTLKVDEGQSVALDITVPISKLHTVTGTLVDARTGSVINAGTVKLFTQDDNQEIASTKVEFEDQTYHFEFVPEGEYVVRVADAREVTREYLPVTAANQFDDLRPKETTVRSYGPYEGPMVVQNDLTSANLAMPVKAESVGKR